MARFTLPTDKSTPIFIRPRFELNVTIKYHKNLIVNFQLITQSLSGQGRHRRKFCHQETSAGCYSNIQYMSLNIHWATQNKAQCTTGSEDPLCKYRLLQWLTTFLTQHIISFFFITINNRTPIFHMIAGVRRNFSLQNRNPILQRVSPYSSSFHCTVHTPAVTHWQVLVIFTVRQILYKDVKLTSLSLQYII